MGSSARAQDNWGDGLQSSGASSALTVRDSIILDTATGRINVASATVEYTCIEGGHAGVGNLDIAKSPYAETAAPY